jgi:hypothetical protein
MGAASVENTEKIWSTNFFLAFELIIGINIRNFLTNFACFHHIRSYADALARKLEYLSCEI